jgi:hypothetical protein
VLGLALRFREHATTDVRAQSQLRASHVICAEFPSTVDRKNRSRDLRTVLHRNMHSRRRKCEQYFNVVGAATDQKSQFSKCEIPLTSIKRGEASRARTFLLLRSAPCSRRGSAADDRNYNNRGDRKTRPSSTLARVSAARSLRVSISICWHVEQLLLRSP